MSLVHEPIYLEWHSLNPKKDMIGKLKSVITNEGLPTQEEKLLAIKNVVNSYIFDHEKHYFEESMSHLRGTVMDIVSQLTQGI